MNSRLSQDQIKTDCHASREFLLNSPIVPEYRIQRLLPEDAEIEKLKNHFPEIQAGEVFIKGVGQRTSDHTNLGAMAIRIDTVRSGSDPKAATAESGLVFLAGLIDRVATGKERFWGLVYRGILGLFIPGEDESRYKAAAESIRSEFTRSNRGTVSIGIASYPDDHSPRERIMDNAVKALDHAAFLGPDIVVRFDSVSLNISGDRLYAEGDIQGCIAEFQHALRLDPSNVNVRNSLGVCYGVLKQYTRAINEFEAAIRLAPGEVMAVYNYGLVKMLTHHPDEALNYFLEAERIRDDIFEVAFHIGKIYLRLDQPEKALTYFNKAEALNAKTGTLYRLMGKCHVRLGNPDQAIAAYTQAVRINPNDAEALSDLGHQYDLRDENLEIATVFCESSTRLDPKNGCFHYRLGRLYRKAQRLSDAMEAFEKAAALGYDSQDAIDEIIQRLNENSEKASNM